MLSYQLIYHFLTSFPILLLFDLDFDLFQCCVGSHFDNCKASIMSETVFRQAPVVTKKEEKETKTPKTVMFEGVKDEQFLSIFTRSAASGPCSGLAKGPKDNLLL